MQLRTMLWSAVVAGALWSAWQRFELRPVHPPDGVLAADEPQQSPPADSLPLQHGHWQLTPRAEYDVTARILAREDYRFDAMAPLSREDLALGWGPMSDNRVLAHFDISQGARFYNWRPRDTLPIARAEVVRHSANTHLIAADDGIRRQLERLRVGQVVHLRGELVDGKRDDGAALRTSLTRDDEGAGACEVLLVRSVEVAAD
jgi:hypothetical protein